jgi:hypothetical protein
MGLLNRLSHAWNAFMGRDPTWHRGEYGNAQRPDRKRLNYGNERSFVGAIYNRIAIDVAAIRVEHAQLDEEGRYKEPIKDSLNDCFSLAANVDQTGRAFMQDVAMSLMDEGCVAIVPTDCDVDPGYTGSYNISELRVGKIVEWFPEEVRVELYNERVGRKEEVLVKKSYTAIVENPLYQVMNQYNSTLQRLIRKLNLLDSIDEQSASGKLDLIIQLPYSVKSPAKRALAADRLNDIEQQLSGSKYGIAYIDATEHVTQLNRAVENKLLNQIEYYTNMVYSQLGITQAVFDGTAKEEEMLNYYNRTIEPIISAIVDAMRWKFLTPNARTRGQSIVFFRDAFRLVPVNQMAEIADKFTRNEILSSNEVRQIIGYKPSNQEGADELRNKNLNKEVNEQTMPATSDENKEENQNGI